MIYYFVDDSAARLGGAELTLSAIKQGNLSGVMDIRTIHLDKHEPRPDCTYVFGNISQLMTAEHFKQLFKIMDTCPFVSIQFDYGFCKYRGRVCHKYLSGGQECNCPDEGTLIAHQYKMIRQKAAHIFFMSNAQMEMHEEHLGESTAPTSVLSSCFDALTLNTLEQRRYDTKNGKYLIVEGQPGWHRIAKGVDHAIEHAKKQELDFEVVSTDTHEEMLDLLCRSYGLVFTPMIHDTCPRIAIEAKLAGCDVITNNMAQHTVEEWWQRSPDGADTYLRNRPEYFWRTVECLSQS